MDDIYLYLVDIPGKSREIVTPCFGGYTVYIDVKLSYEEKIDAYHHAMKHIADGDFDKDDVQEVETNAHKKGERNGTF